MRVKILAPLLLLAGCATHGTVQPDPLVIASCPPLQPVQIVTPADSYRLHVEDARQYNVCRCAALKGTDQACKAPAQNP